MVRNEINRIYNMDVEAIRNLGAISKSLLTGTNTFTSSTTGTPGTLTIPADNTIFQGNLTIPANNIMTGNVTGNLTGNVTGNLTGNVTGNLTGNVQGNVTGNVAGNVQGNVNSNKITINNKGMRIWRQEFSNIETHTKTIAKDPHNNLYHSNEWVIYASGWEVSSIGVVSAYIADDGMWYIRFNNWSGYNNSVDVIAIPKGYFEVVHSATFKRGM